MTRTSGITRRAFVSGLVAGAPTLLFAPRLLTQIPPRGRSSSLPYGLRDTLAVAPVTAYEGVLLEPVPWIGTSFSPYLSSVGGVHVLIADRSAAPFGSYVVYRDDAGARNGLFLGKRALENATRRTRTREIEDYASEVVVYRENGPRAVTLVPVGNVLVIGNDTIVETGDKPGWKDNEARSIDHASLLIRHLLGVMSGGSWPTR